MKLIAVLKDQSKNGLFNIKIRVTANRQVGYIKTDFYCFKDNFNSKDGFLKEVRIKKGEETQELKDKQIAHDFQNSKIRELLAFYNRKYAQLSDKERSIRWIIEYFKDGAGEDLNLLNYYDEFIKNLNKQNRTAYASSHNTTKTWLEEFTSSKTIPFKSVNYIFLESFENWLKKKECSINTIAIYMRNIRVVFNDAIKREKIELGLYPFRRYELTRRLKPVIKKRNLSVEIIKKLKAIELADNLECMARDVFMLSFYLIGINLKDLYNLEKINDGRIQYFRAKTKRYYDVKVFPAALQLLEKYKGKQNLLIFKELYSDYRNLNKVVNVKLKAISQSEDLKLATIPTTYYARHSWATIASQLGVPKDTISHALGHGNNSVTDVYIDFNLDKVDQANELVIHSIK